MFTTYRRVLALPGAKAFSATGLVARLPISMVTLGIVLLVSSRTGSYALAGAVSAAYLVGNAGFAVLQARLVDRLGQGRVLPWSISLFAVALVLAMVAVEAGWPTPLAAPRGRGRRGGAPPGRLLRPGPLVAPGPRQAAAADRVRARGGGRRGGLPGGADPGHLPGHGAAPAGRARRRGRWPGWAAPTPWSRSTAPSRRPAGCTRRTAAAAALAGARADDRVRVRDGDALRRHRGRHRGVLRRARRQGASAA